MIKCTEIASGDLEVAASKLLDAMMEYRKAYKECDKNISAVIWVEDTDGRLIIMTRGEYKSVLMENIGNAGVERLF